MKMNLLKLIATVSLLLAGASAQAGNTEPMQELLTGAVMQFNQGDVIPLTLKMEGDLLETREAGAVYLTVKKDFWLRARSGDIEISFDGQNYGPLTRQVGGSLGLGTDGQGSFELLLRNTLK